MIGFEIVCFKYKSHIYKIIEDRQQRERDVCAYISLNIIAFIGLRGVTNPTHTDMESGRSFKHVHLAAGFPLATSLPELPVQTNRRMQHHHAHLAFHGNCNFSTQIASSTAATPIITEQGHASHSILFCC